MVAAYASTFAPTVERWSSGSAAPALPHGLTIVRSTPPPATSTTP